MGKEVVSLFVGQCGVQCGNAFWEQMAGEYGIKPDGDMPSPQYLDLERSYNTGHDPCSTSFFTQSYKGNWTPRAFMIDLEPTVVDEIRTGIYKNLYNPSFIMNSFEDAGNCFPRGYRTIGRTIIERVTDSMRSHIEECESIQGILLFNSFNGGTGSGLTSLIIEEIVEEYGKTTKICSTISPSRHFAQNNVEPYNAILAYHYTSPNTDVNFVYDNASLYSLCGQRLSIKNPNYCTANRLLAQVYSSLTCCTRYGGVLTGGLVELQTNLVPYPRIHFPICSYSPLVSNEKYNHQSLNTSMITRNVFDSRSTFAEVELDKGKYMSCILIYRGKVNPVQCYEAMNNMKSSRMKFVDWCPTGFKVSVCKQPPCNVLQSHMATTPMNALLMANNTSMAEVFRRIVFKFNHLYKKKAFIHWFTAEGMDEEEFGEGIENLDSLVKDYEECAGPNDDEEKNKNQNAYIDHLEMMDADDIEDIHISYKASTENNNYDGIIRESPSNMENNDSEPFNSESIANVI